MITTSLRLARRELRPKYKPFIGDKVPARPPVKPRWDEVEKMGGGGEVLKAPVKTLDLDSMLNKAEQDDKRKERVRIRVEDISDGA